MTKRRRAKHITETSRPVANPKTLREAAEQRVGKRESSSAEVLRSVDGLGQELEIHRIELELQNDELRAAQTETEQALDRYTELFDFAPIGYATLTPGGVVRELNHTGALLLKSERARLLGKQFAAFVAIKDELVFRNLLERACRSASRQSCELELHAGDECPIQASLTVAGITRPEPTLLLAFEDITERKAKEAQLVHRELAERRTDEFLAVLSHELRNPLAPIRTGVYVLARVDSGSEEARKMHAIIDRQVTHLTRLIDDLLDVTRIRRGKIELHTERTHLVDLVRRTLDDHRRAFEQRHISLEESFESEPLYVDGDPTRLIQVLSNLLGNAEKFTEQGGKVRVSVRAENSMAVLCVADTGVGIASQELEHVFDPFAQAPQTIERARGGLGLGLSMVKGLIELHGGTVSVRSGGAGQGTVVTVALPLDLRPAPPASVSTPVSVRRLRVVVIDDHPDAADTLRDALSFLGHEVQVAYDGPSGLACARGSRPDVVICDIGLPGMDGYGVARRVRAEPHLQSVYLVALSGYARPEDLKQATDAGFDRHLAKPADLGRLNELLAEVDLSPSRSRAARGTPASHSSVRD